MGVDVNITGDYLKNGISAINPSVIALSAANGTVVTGTTAETISRSLLVPANTFSTNGMLEIFMRTSKTGTLGALTTRIYRNSSASLTGATLLGNIGSGSNLFQQGIRTFRINSNSITGIQTSSVIQSDYQALNNAPFSTTFTTSVDNFIIFAVQLGNASDSAVIEMARLVKYV